jgi:uncharacterized phage protein gp47/JayE
MAGLAYSLYGYLDWIALEAVPFTSTDEFLEAWAALVGILRKDATAAIGTAEFTGTAGIFVAAGTALTRQDATPYVSTADATVASTGVLTVSIAAEVMGAATDCDDGTPIGFATPITGINNQGYTVGPCTGGSDQETDDALRSRMLARYRSPPQGGSAADYQEWATAVPGCTRAWIENNGMGAGTVIVRVMFDSVEAAHGGFPQGNNGCASEETRGPTATGDQLAVAEAIWPVQPVTSLVWVVAPVPAPVNVTLANLDPNTPDIQAAIIASISDMLLITAAPGGTVYPSDLYEAISATPDVVHFTMTSPTQPFVAAVGGLPVMGNLTVLAG